MTSERRTVQLRLRHSHQVDGQAIEHEHDHAQGEHSHADLSQAVRLLSIGIDVGSATSHFAVSSIHVGRRDPFVTGKPEVLKRTLLYKSPIVLTPFLDPTTIDAEALEAFLIEHATRAGISLDAIDTGAVICTGEAARKENAAAITQRLSEIGGRFVCATAGHHLEALLAAHGSGAVDASRTRDEVVINLDIGGGTAKRSVLSTGRVLHTGALNVGTRLIAWDDHQRVIRAEAAGLALAAAIGADIRVGEVIPDETIQLLASLMARCLIQYLGLEPMDDVTRSLLLTGPPPALAGGALLLVSGGFSEYFYGREHGFLSDLGASLGPSFRALLSQQLPTDHILDSPNGIRATVIGAGQFSMQVSGDTLFLDGRLRLPLTNVPVFAVPVEWSHLGSEGAHSRITDVLRRLESSGLVALSFKAAPRYGYGSYQQLARDIARAFDDARRADGVVLVFEHNVARIVGATLTRLQTRIPFLCVDELKVGDLEYLDIGEPPEGEAFVPVVVKSLVFS